MNKQLQRVYAPPAGHWVGDGFPVRSLLTPNTGASPFLLLDHAGPAEFPSSDEPRGVDEHPHRGFETVTIVYSGELEHRDSAGNKGSIGPGDVQWMTAASGVVHEEKHSDEFTRKGGLFEVVQLWVNLPAKHKMNTPGYQTLLNSQIPNVDLDVGSVRIIAGEFRGIKGPAHTFTPLNVWDMRARAGHSTELDLPAGHTAVLAVLRGAVTLNGSDSAGEGELAVFHREGENISLKASQDSTILVLSGEPIDEPVASYGPFVMNSQQEIAQAIQDYQTGRMGALAAA